MKIQVVHNVSISKNDIDEILHSMPFYDQNVNIHTFRKRVSYLLNEKINNGYISLKFQNIVDTTELEKIFIDNKKALKEAYNTICSHRKEALKIVEAKNKEIKKNRETIIKLFEENKGLNVLLNDNDNLDSFLPREM